MFFGLDTSIAPILALDGLSSGVIYGLVAIALVLVFAVTRILFFPQGEFVVFGALTLAMLQSGMVPGTVWLLLLLAMCATATRLLDHLRMRESAGIGRTMLFNLVVPCTIAALAAWAAPLNLPLPLQVGLTLLLVTALGPLLYTVVYESMADASVLVLLIVSVGVHLAAMGLGLVFFGAEGFRTPAFWDGNWSFGALMINGQTVVVVLAAAVLLVGLWQFFERTLYGKALRATAINRLGARLMGVSTALVGRLALAMAAFIGALSGMLVGPTTTIFYDSGFVIGIKGFVVAVIGGLASFPATAAGALFIGLLESFSSFWASDYKEIIVFMSLLPILLWRSLSDPAHDEEEESAS